MKRGWVFFRVKHGEKITIGKRERENESRTVTSVGPFFFFVFVTRDALPVSG